MILPLSPRWNRLVALVLLVFIIVLIPVGNTLADANPPATETKTPEPTNTAPPQPTEPPSATNTPIPILPTEEEDSGAIAIITPLPPVNGSGLSTIDRFLLMVLTIAVVIVIGVIVYIFMHQARGGLDER